jgi:hypothetical protein
MVATYVTGGVGIALGFYGLSSDPASLTLATLLAVGLAGLLSFLRHSVFHRSDAVRMGWDLGRRNNFQIEVGLANLAWGLTGTAAVVFGWGIQAQATSMLTFGLYLVAVTVMQLISPGGKRRGPVPLVSLGAFGLMLCVLGIWAMQIGPSA